MNKYKWEDKEQFLADWNNSKNKCDFLKNNNLTATSGNYATFNKWLKLHNENTLQKSELSYNEIFIENSPCNRKHIKNLIENNNLIPYKCAECSNIGIWNNKPIKLQLEHKNGINNDHRLENLTYLCPNCHSQTTTYSGKNIHSKLFLKRLEDLKNHSIININSLDELSKIWNINISSIRLWINKYKTKLEEYNIYLDNNIILEKQNKRSKAKTTVKLIKIQRKHRISDVEKYKNEKNIIQILSIKWNVSRIAVKRWLQKNTIEYYNQQSIVQIQKQVQNDFSNRFIEASLLTNKKQVPDLAKKWEVSDTGAKKWLKNNIPQKFKEIYDDKLLEKNQILIKKNEKANYMKLLTVNNFYIEKVIQDMETNKSGVYALLKYYNPMLYEQLTNHIICKFCNNKVRTSGTNKDGKTVYRCLYKECGKSFIYNTI